MSFKVNQNQPQNPEQSQKLIWFAMLGSISTFYFLANFGGIQKGMSEQPDESVKYIFLAAAGLAAVGSYFFRSKTQALVNEQSKEIAQKKAEIVTWSILTWALSESVAIIGFMLCIAFDDLALGNGLITTGLILLGFYRPITINSYGGESNNLRKSYKNENKR